MSIFNDANDIRIEENIVTAVYLGDTLVWSKNFVEGTNGNFEDGVGDWVIDSGPAKLEIETEGIDGDYAHFNTSSHSDNVARCRLTITVPVGVTLRYKLFAFGSSDSDYSGDTPEIRDGIEIDGELLIAGMGTDEDWTEYDRGTFVTISDTITIWTSLTWSDNLSVDNIEITME